MASDHSSTVPPCSISRPMPPPPYEMMLRPRLSRKNGSCAAAQNKLQNQASTPRSLAPVFFLRETCHLILCLPSQDGNAKVNSLTFLKGETYLEGSQVMSLMSRKMNFPNIS